MGGAFMIALVIVVSIVLLIVMTFYFLSSSKASMESGREALFSEHAGGRIGTSTMHFPFLRVTLYEDFLVLSTFKKLIIPLSDISELGESRFKDNNLEIKMKNPGSYPYISFACKNQDYLKMLILNAIQ